MGPAEMERIAEWMDRVAEAPGDDSVIAKVADEVRELSAKFPVPGIRD
jgi:glycine hydroxymethyltransferase